MVAQYHSSASPVPGFDLLAVSDVPLGGGLSSSAALEVSVATAVEVMLGVNGATASGKKDKSLKCQAAEHQYCSMYGSIFVRCV